MKPRLLATAATVSGIAEMVNRYWYSENYRVNPETLAIEHPEKTITGYQIRLAKGRYRFECIPAMKD